jgi:hypothetical protein
MHATTSEVQGSCEAGPSTAARRSQRRAMGFVLTWAVTMALATLALASDLSLPPAARWALAILPTLVGIGMLAAYIAFLRASDELQRKIQVEALALGFGAGFLAMNGYRLLERAGAPAIDVNDVAFVMLAAFALGMLLGQRRYS